MDVVAAVCALAVVMGLVATTVQYRMYLRAVERYHRAVGDHDKVLDFAHAIRAADPGPPAPAVTPGTSGRS